MVTTGGGIGAQGSEEVIGEVDGLAFARAALVDQFAGRGLAVEGDGGHAAAVGVAVGLRAHHALKKRLEDDHRDNKLEDVDLETYHVREQRHPPRYRC